MSRKTRRLVPAAAVLAVAAFLSGGRAHAADGKADQQGSSASGLTGRWALDEGLSDDPAEKMAEHGSESHAGEGGHGGFGMGGHGGGRGGGGSHGGGSRGSSGESGHAGGKTESSGTPDEVLWDVRHIVVTDGPGKDPLFVVERADGGKRVLFTDGRRVEEDHGAGTTKIRAKRKGGKVVVDTEYPNGREAVETWELLEGTRNLVVTTKVSGKGRNFSFRRVFDPEPAPAPTPVP